MTLCTAEWAEGSARTVDSSVELLSLLDELATDGRDSPILVNVLNSRTGDIMSIGVGGSRSVLSFTPASLDPPYLTSLSELGSSCDDGVEVFFYFGAWTEIPKRHLIPNELAREALLEFASYGRRSTQVRWEET